MSEHLSSQCEDFECPKCGAKLRIVKEYDWQHSDSRYYPPKKVLKALESEV